MKIRPKQIISLTTRFSASPDQVWEEVNRPRLLLYVAYPMIRLKAVDPPALPERWEERDYLVSMRLCGFLPLGNQVISLSRPEPSKSAFFLRDNGHSASIRRWDHLITVAADAGETIYTDRVEIDAGFRTPVVATLARQFYAHRQKRWQKLVQADFNY